jgi:hypothetical protein
MAFWIILVWFVLQLIFSVMYFAEKAKPFAAVLTVFTYAGLVYLLWTLK